MNTKLAFLVLCIFIFLLSANADPSVVQRQALPTSGTTTPGSTPSTTQPPNTSSATTSSTSSQPPTTQDQQSSTGPSSASSQQPSTSATAPTQLTSATSTPTASPSTTAIISTDSGGQEVTVTQTFFPTDTTSSSLAAPSASGTNKPDSGLGTGSIIGLSVAAGVALIGIVGFFVWKLTRKRKFSDFDDNEAIKWPELNTHGGNPDSHPLPTHSTGRSGFETASDLSRQPSLTSSSHQPVNPNASTPDLYADPYAVPPLPHLNPNQPYRDDPNAAVAAGYYDPYRGPVPNTFNDPEGPWDGGAPGGEAIPMTQMGGGAAARVRSPGPGMAYETGRGSPGPAAPGYGRRSPGPVMAYAVDGPERTMSPYGAPAPGRRSPGPNMAYDVGRRSPGPGAAYDAYGAR